MNNQELLEQKIKEFKQDHKMSHIEYGLPFVTVFDGSVVFCKNKQVFEKYQKKQTAFSKKITVAISMIIATLSYGIIGSMKGLSNLAILSGLFIIFTITGIINLLIDRNARKSNINFKDVIVYNGPSWDN